MRVVPFHPLLRLTADATVPCTPGVARFAAQSFAAQASADAPELQKVRAQLDAANHSPEQEWKEQQAWRLMDLRQPGRPVAELEDVQAAQQGLSGAPEQEPNK